MLRFSILLLILSSPLLAGALECPDYYGTKTDEDTVCSPCYQYCKRCQYYQCQQCDRDTYLTGYYCTACKEGEYSDGGQAFSCSTCEDPGCAKCPGPGKGVCLACSKGWYMDGETKTCRWCGLGQFSPYNSTSPTQCGCKYYLSKPSFILLGCEDTDCTQCDAKRYFCTACRPGMTIHYTGCRYGAKRPPHCTVQPNPEDHSSLLCSNCSKGYRLEASKTSCIACKAPNCSSCPINAQGVERCLDCFPGFYKTTSDTCTKCDDKECAKCSGSGQNQCQACNNGFTLTNSTCIACNIENCVACDSSQKCSACKNGYYLDLQNNQCKYCGDGSASPIGATSPTQCGTCQSPGDLTCWSATYKNASVTCKPGYALKVYDTIDSNWTSCVECPSNCKNCDTTTTCNTCNRGYYLNEAKQCALCQDTYCDECLSSGTGKCTTCGSGFLQDGKCNLACRDSNCTACSGPGLNSCTACSLGYIINKKTGQCEACGTGCDTCSNPGKCLSCSAGYYSSSDVCEKCPIGKHSPPGSSSIYACYNCADYNCTSCTGSGKGTCLACTDDFGVNLQKKCQKCSLYNCKACFWNSQNKEQCTKCATGYTVYSYTGQCERCSDYTCIDCFGLGAGKCSVCQAGYFVTRENNCQTCDYSCISCSGSSKNCSACKSGYLMTQENTCEIICPAGYFRTRENTCQNCADGCTLCYGDRNNCSACQNGYFKPRENTCQPCADKGCASCSDGDGKCLACKSEYYMQDNRCVSCPEGRSSPAGSTRPESCIICQDNGCKRCSGAQGTSVCEACSDPYYSAWMRCERCPSTCKVCYGPQACTQCERGHQVSSGYCVPCPQGTFVNAEGNCQICDTGCQACGGAGSCTSCLAGFYLKGDKCIGCEDGKYPSSTSYGGTSPSYCRDCDTPYCSKCTGPGIMPGTCLGCKSGFYILSGTGICAPCLDLGCDSCLWTGMRQCTSCKANFYLQDNECTPCSFGMTSKIGSQHCEIANSSIVVIGVIGVLAAAVVIYLKKQPKSLSPQPKRISMTSMTSFGNYNSGNVQDPMLRTQGSYA